MNLPISPHPSDKLLNTMNTAFRYAVVAGLFGLAGWLAWQVPSFRAAFSWPDIGRWLVPGGTVWLVATAVICALTVVIFAANPDWHTGEGCLGLGFCLLAEIVIMAALAGLGLLIMALTKLSA